MAQLPTFIIRRSMEWISVCFPRETGGKIFRFKRKPRRRTLLKARNLNRGKIPPSNNVINILLFGLCYSIIRGLSRGE